MNRAVFTGVPRPEGIFLCRTVEVGGNPVSRPPSRSTFQSNSVASLGDSMAFRLDDSASVTVVRVEELADRFPVLLLGKINVEWRTHPCTQNSVAHIDNYITNISWPGPVDSII